MHNTVNIDDLGSSPSPTDFCLSCEKKLEQRSTEGNKEFQRRKFCNRSCSATLNGRLYPKRFKQGLCNECGIPQSAGRTYCSKLCRGRAKAKRLPQLLKKQSKRVADYRRSLKKRMIEYLGGKCRICGYSLCAAALVPHHRNPSEKEFSLSRHGNIRKWDILVKELDKCCLLCIRCHAEAHAGIHSLQSLLVIGATSI